MNMKTNAILLSVFCFAIALVQVLPSFSQSQLRVNEPLRSRQVHLDFHTSELISGIGEKFDKKKFQEALKAGRVNQLNIFSKIS